MKLTYANDAVDGVRLFRAALRNVQPGDGLVYHTGETWSLDKKTGAAADTLFAEGRVHLVQKRVGTSPEGHPIRDYIAVKRRQGMGNIARHLQIVNRRHA